ncbi:hypothetical protein CROQUDRAFT_655224 [Cronartium quercuum f. sp. fusiforme G11]|uniref:C2 NT-type domain-containing protein n=1 Tax=Cronartium quercuum f. sp. fusiforme G11 TaxID=708437 RepID=A0A9P6NPZ4_9BASI|nr:hypothetical protein CROQUDRAFT_655224 [Cronartium quercuum f. sp. fusiforme G11]
MDTLQRALHLAPTVTFDCAIIIDQLVNVPLLNGKFKLKWKFEHPITTVHIDAQMKAKHVATTITHRLTMSDDEAQLALTPTPANRRWAIGVPDCHQHEPDQRQRRSSTMDRNKSLAALPSLDFSSTESGPSFRADLSTRDQSHRISHPPKEAFRARSGSSSIGATSTPTLNNPFFGSETHSSPPGLLTSPTLMTSTLDQPTRAESSGSTSYVQVKNHIATFRHPFRCPVSIVIDKDGTLQPSLLTIIIKEEHVADEGKREVSRHGTLTIDLSKYTPTEVEEGKFRIEKGKFLLQDCKTNASLKVQIQMKYISGAPGFKTPTATASTSVHHFHHHHQHDDTKSVSSTRKSSASSPNSSVVSSNSSGKIPSTTAMVKGVQLSQSTFNPTHPRSIRPHQAETSSQIADELIDVLFSSTYIPSSGPVSQRLQGAKASKTLTPKAINLDTKSLHLSMHSNEANQTPSSSSTLSFWEHSSFLKPKTKDKDNDDDTSSRKSVKSFHSKFKALTKSHSMRLKQ